MARIRWGWRRAQSKPRALPPVVDDQDDVADDAERLEQRVEELAVAGEGVTPRVVVAELV
jgi:hypothetical protein